MFTKENLHFEKGDDIFNEQDEGKEMYLIDSGEMTLITGSRRVASAIAFTDCNLHVMDKEAFMSNIANNRDFVSRILVTLAHRLEGTDLSFTLLFKLISKSSKP